MSRYAAPRHIGFSIFMLRRSVKLSELFDDKVLLIGSMRSPAFFFFVIKLLPIFLRLEISCMGHAPLNVLRVVRCVVADADYTFLIETI